MTHDEKVHKIGPIYLAPSVLPQHAWSLIAASFFSIGLMIYISVGQPYVFNEHLHIPTSEQGSLSGTLILLTEAVALLFFIPAGIVMDRVGRRAVYAFGFILFAIAYALYPLATAVEDLFAYRIVYALGVVAVAGGLSTVMADYPAERSRGKMVALIGFVTGLGVYATIEVLGGLPETFTAKGMSGTEAGLYAFYTVAAICIVVAILVMLGLQAGVPITRGPRPGIRELLISGFAAAKNPRILLSYTAAFIARGDQSVNGAYLALWGNNAALAVGMTTAEAATRGAFMFAMSQVGALLWAPFIGPILDRLDRVTGMALCMALAAIGNLAVLLLLDPLASHGIFFFFLLGVGQFSAFFAAQALIGQEAPQAKRGTVLGAFNISGTIGIMIIAWTGGQLFDVDPRAPFVLVGVMNVALFLASLYLRLRSQSLPEPAELASGEAAGKP